MDGRGTFLNLPMSQAWSSFGQWPGKSVEVTFVTISASTPTTCTNSSQLRARETAREGNPLAAGLRDQRKAFAACVCVVRIVWWVAVAGRDVRLARNGKKKVI